MKTYIIGLTVISFRRAALKDVDAYTMQQINGGRWPNTVCHYNITHYTLKKASHCRSHRVSQVSFIALPPS